MISHMMIGDDVNDDDDCVSNTDDIAYDDI